MARSTRRSFLKTTAAAGLAGSANLLMGRPSWAQVFLRELRAFILIRGGTISPIDRNIFGSFLEHLGRAFCMRGSTIRDRSCRMRTDSAKTRWRKSRRSTCRLSAIPAGILSRVTTGSTAWARGRSGRMVLDKAWNSLEPEPVRDRRIHGVVQTGGHEPLMGLNLGTGTPEKAAALVEYCNIEKGTQWSDLRRTQWHCGTVQGRALVPGQRDGRPVADRAHVGHGYGRKAALRRGRCGTSIIR